MTTSTIGAPAAEIQNEIVSFLTFLAADASEALEDHRRVAHEYHLSLQPDMRDNHRLRRTAAQADIDSHLRLRSLYAKGLGLYKSPQWANKVFARLAGERNPINSTRYFIPPKLDHQLAWIRRGNGLARITSEPYWGHTEVDKLSLFAELDEWQREEVPALRFRLAFDFGWHNPPGCCLVEWATPEEFHRGDCLIGPG